MSYREIYPEDEGQPAEYESDNPAECAECGAEWDRDEDQDKFVEIGEEIFCRGACAEINRDTGDEKHEDD